MLELDWLLDAFVERQYSALSDHEKQVFVKLLQTPDPELFAWIIAEKTPADTEFWPMIEKLRQGFVTR